MHREPPQERLVLAGGGHAHLFVLEQLAQQRSTACRVQLVSPSRWQYYSGMLPGWLAGHYTLEQCRLDLVALCAAAGVEFIEQSVVGLDTRARQVRLEDGRTLAYDRLSLDIGSETRVDWAQDYTGPLLSIKPLERFQADWDALLERFRQHQGGSLAVVGGGAAGVELVMAAARAFEQQDLPVTLWLLAGEAGPLAGMSPGARQRIRRELARCGVRVLSARARGQGSALLAGAESLSVDAVIAASGARAPAWLATTGLALDEAGFVLVDEFQRSPSHPEVSAAGDICARPGTALSRSGVYSVRAGPVLAHNLIATAEGKPLRRYLPRRRSLYLISCGGRRALALWGRLSLAADGCWLWKDWIDRRFMARFKGEESD